jgi:uncharacterized protein YjbI with pentapeptide repeats
VGCQGIYVPGHTSCLAHLSDSDRDAYLAGLAPGANIDHRGTPFTESLLSSLLRALRDPITAQPHLGAAQFEHAQFSGNVFLDGARFSGNADFQGAQFSGDAQFRMAQFAGGADFQRAQFSGYTWFDRARFSSYAWFRGAEFAGDAFNSTRFDEVQFSGSAQFGMARFSRDADFRGAQFSSDADFVGVQFSDSAVFNRAQFSNSAMFVAAHFSGNARFDGTQFSGDADFREARFAAAASFGPVVCAGTVDLTSAVFQVPVTLEIAAREVRCDRTRWESTATARLRYATMDLSDAVFSSPVAVTAQSVPFTVPYWGTAVKENLLEDQAGHEPGVRMASVRGVDAAHLVLTDIDLSDCLFSGAFHLDQLRLEGRCTFASTPTGLHRRFLWPYRWSRRRSLAEEHHWRGHTARQPAQSGGATLSSRDWRTGPHHPDDVPDPADVAALYRQLRKAFEDAKNEPGAADFYYGEMEMRRHDRVGASPSERGLLWAYWLVSGYGLRASRALGWLLAAMTATVVILMLWGIPATDLQPATTGRDEETLTLTTDTHNPVNPTGPISERLTTDRFEKALRVVINSTVFRSSAQDLTTAGTYIELASRFTTPVLLALAVFAMRSRIKR